MNPNSLMETARGKDLVKQKLACLELAQLGYDKQEIAEFLVDLLCRSCIGITHASARAALTLMQPAALEAIQLRLQDEEGLLSLGGTRLVHLLLTWGPAAKTLLPDLERLLAQGNWHSTLDAIAAMGPEAGGSAEAVAEQFYSGDAPALRVAVTLGKLGPQGKPYLVKELQSTDKGRRIAAIEGLSHLGRQALPELLPLLSEEDEAIQFAVAHGLRLLEVNARSLYLKLLDSNPDYARGTVLKDLGKFGVADREMERRLVALYNKRPSAEVVKALGRWGTLEGSGDLLTKAIEEWFASDRDFSGVGREALNALALLVRTAKPCSKHAALFRKIVRDALDLEWRNRETRAAVALEALGFYPDEMEKTLPLIKEVLERDEKALLPAAVQAARHLGPRALPLLPLFLQAMFTSAFHLEISVSSILLSIGPGSFPLLTQLLREAAPEKEESLGLLLAVIARSIRDGVCAEERQDVLMPKVMQADDYERQALIDKWNEQAERVSELRKKSTRIQLDDWREAFFQATLPLASSRLKDKSDDWRCCYRWAEALVNYGQDTVPLLIGYYKRSGPETRHSLSYVVAELPQLYAPVFMQMLQTAADNMVFDLAESLRHCGKESLEAVPLLEAFLPRLSSMEQWHLDQAIRFIKNRFLAYD